MNNERALLSCISQDPSVVGSEVLGIFQHDNPFESDICKRVYHAWAVQKDRNTWNTPSILEKLDTSTFTADWLTELRSVMNTEPSTANWRQHLDAVRVEYTRRIATTELEQALHMLKDVSNVQTLLSDVSKKLTNIDTSNEDEISVEQCINEEIERRRNETLSITTGLTKIDSYTGPLIPGDILLLAARPSVGKSVVAHNIIRNIAQRCPVGLFSLEMPVAQVVARMVSGVAQQDSRIILDNMHNQEIWKAYEWVKNLPIYYDDRAGLSIAQIVNRIRRWHTNYDIKAVVLDYIQLVKGRRKPHETISDAMKDVKAVCQELGIVPIILAQINRSGAQNESGRPTLEDLKGSGSLEEDSSYVVLMHRDVVLTNEQRESVDKGGAVDIEIAVAKNRHGPTGYNKLAFIPKYCMVQDAVIDEKDVPK